MAETTPAAAPDATTLKQAQKRRNAWLALALVAFVVIVGVTTAIRIQETDFSGGDRLYFSGYLDEAAKDKANREAEARADALASEQAAEEPAPEGAGDE